MTSQRNEALYMQLGRLIEAMPDLTVMPMPPSNIQWLGRAYALVLETGEIVDANEIKRQGGYLRMSHLADKAAEDIAIIVHRALAVAEMRAPAAAQGAFIPAGNVFDGFAAVGKVLASSKVDVLIIDPYLDDKVLTDFAPTMAEGITIRLLADQQGVKPSLKPAVTRWQTQHEARRPLEAKVAPPRTLHDRLIIVDSKDAWVLTQSLNAFADRSPASIVKSPDDQAALKIDVYGMVWEDLALPI